MSVSNAGVGVAIEGRRQFRQSTMHLRVFSLRSAAAPAAGSSLHPPKHGQLIAALCVAISRGERLQGGGGDKRLKSDTDFDRSGYPLLSPVEERRPPHNFPTWVRDIDFTLLFTFNYMISS